MVFVQLIIIQLVFHLHVLVQVFTLVCIVKIQFIQYYKTLLTVYRHVSMVALVLMVFVCVPHNILDQLVNMVNKISEEFFFFFKSL